MTAFDLGLEGLIEGAVVLVLPLRIARTLLAGGLRRKLLVFPRTAASILAGSIGTAAVIALAALWAPAWRALAAGALALIVTEAWMGRAGFGRVRGMPPGSLALAPLGPWVDPDFYAKQAGRHGPVFKMRHLAHPQVCVADLELAREFLRRHDAELRVPPLPFDRFVPGGFIRYMEGDAHRVRRAVLRTAMAPDVVDAAEPGVRGLMREALAELARDGARRHPREFLDRTVLTGAACLFFGFAPGSDEMARLQRSMRTIDFRLAWRVPARRVRRALDDVLALLHAQPPAGFLGALAAADPAASRDTGTLINLVYVLNSGGWSDVASLMSWITWWLARNPGWLGKLRAADAPDAMAERIVRETLRLSQSEYIVRRATQRLEVGGYVVPAGWLVRVCIRDIHRRADVFPEAASFRPDRFLNPPGPDSYAPFGASRISCLGEHTTLMFGRALAVELARAYEIAVAADGPPELGAFHWRPGREFRVRLTPASAGRLAGGPGATSGVSQSPDCAPVRLETSRPPQVATLYTRRENRRSDPGTSTP